jgi:hypothetical protein
VVEDPSHRRSGGGPPLAPQQHHELGFAPTGILPPQPLDRARQVPTPLGLAHLSWSAGTFLQADQILWVIAAAPTIESRPRQAKHLADILELAGAAPHLQSLQALRGVGRKVGGTKLTAPDHGPGQTLELHREPPVEALFYSFVCLICI